jgi:uroporphyrinogen-III decarboxylase
MMMTPRELMCAAMQREPTQRIPCMPALRHDMGVRVYADEFGGDWLDALKACLEQPQLITDLELRLAQEAGCDGMRMFIEDGPHRVERKGEILMACDPQTGERLGRVDALGGGGIIPDRPAPPIETLAEAKERLAETSRAYSDEQIDLLRQNRARVPEMFVSSPPGGMAMNTYFALRGREQGMIDFYERPDFVRATMELQAEAAIEQGEKLLKADIDAFYIGDASSSCSLISPRQFERFCFPAYRAFCQHFRERLLIYIHVCGNSNPILEMMADTGAHMIDPLDPLGGVSVADAKRRVGDRVAMMGGVNTLTLAFGAPADVRAEAIQKCREGGPYGYVLGAGDMVPGDTPLDNLKAMTGVAIRSLWRG